MKKQFLLFFTLLSAALFAQVPSNVPTSGLVAYFGFNGNANDQSGNGNNGTNYGATLTSDHLGNPNSAYHFDGSGNQYISVPNSSSLAFASNQMSIAFWVKVEAFASGSYNSILISKQSGSGNSQSGFNVAQANQSFLGLLVSNGGGNFGGTNVPSNSDNYNNFHHVVFTFSNGTQTSYLDGVQINNSSGTASIGANTMPLLFGIANWINVNSVPFTGVLDEIAIYNRAITQQEVTQIYSDLPCTSADITTGLVASYPFSGNANDQSGNGNNGINYGATLTSDRFGIANSAYSFDGNDDTITVPSSTSLQFTSDNQSISFWLKVPSLPNPAINDEGILSKINENLNTDATGNSTQGFEIAFSQNGNGDLFYRAKGGAAGGWAWTTINHSLLAANIWEHIVFTFNSVTDSVYSYLNGNEVNSAPIPSGTTIGQNAMPLIIGWANWLDNGNEAYFYNGILDDIRIYSVALTPCGIDSLYNLNSCAGVIATISAQSATTFCQGDSVILTANIDSSYRWSNSLTTQSITVKQTGSYTVTVTNTNNCSAVSSPTVVTVNSLPTVNINPVPNFVNINTPSFAISGNPQGGTFFGSGVSGNNFTPSAAGLGDKLINYTYTNGNNCTNTAIAATIVYDTTGVICSTTDTLIINAQLTGISPPDNFNTLKVYPNPAHESLIVDCGNYLNMNGYQVKIVNSLGQAVFQSAITQQQFNINITTWSVGTYVLLVLDPSSAIISTKEIVIQ